MIHFFVRFVLIASTIHHTISTLSFQTKKYLDKHTCQREYTKPTTTLSNSVSSTKECYRNLVDFNGKDDYCLHKLNSKFFTNCYVLSIDVEYSHSNVNEVFTYLSTSSDDIDSNSAMQMIKITFIDHHLSSKKGTHPHPPTNTSSHFNYTMLGEQIDAFLIPRPWWRVTREPYDWQLNKTNKTDKTTHSSHTKHNAHNTTTAADGSHHHHLNHLTTSTNNQIIFKRVSQPLHPYLHFISKLQYPSAHVCDTTPMLLGYYTCGNPGWTAVMHTYYHDKQSLKYGIHSIFGATKKEFGDFEFATINYFMSEEDCPHKRNLWDCAFLSMTNCSLSIKLAPDGKELRGFSNVYTNAGPHGQKVNLTSNNIEIQAFELTHTNATLLGYPSHKQAVRSLQDYAYVYGVPYNRTYHRHTQAMAADVLETTYIYGFMLRHAYIYRTKIAELLHTFRSQFTPKLTERSECVVAHVRKGR